MYDSIASVPYRSCASRIASKVAKVRPPASSSGGGWKASGLARRELAREQRAALLHSRPRRSPRSVATSAWWCASACSRTSSVARCRPKADRVRIARSRRPWAISAPRCVDERVAHQPQLGQQLAARPRSRAPPRARPPAREPPARVHELLLDAGELQPVRLLGVQAQEARLHLGQQLQVARERLAQLRRGAGDPLRARQVAPQHVDDRDRVAQRRGRAAGRARGRCCPGATFGLPSRSPPIQLPNRERPPLRLRRRAPAGGARPPAPPARRARRRREGRRSTRRRCAPRPPRRAARSAARPSATGGRSSPPAAPSCAGPPAESRSAIWRSL